MFNFTFNPTPAQTLHFLKVVDFTLAALDNAIALERAAVGAIRKGATSDRAKRYYTRALEDSSLVLAAVFTITTVAAQRERILARQINPDTFTLLDEAGSTVVEIWQCWAASFTSTFAPVAEAMEEYVASCLVQDAASPDTAPEMGAIIAPVIEPAPADEAVLEVAALPNQLHEVEAHEEILPQVLEEDEPNVAHTPLLSPLEEPVLEPAPVVGSDPVNLDWLESASKRELQIYAREQGLTVSSKMTKDKLRSAILSA